MATLNQGFYLVAIGTGDNFTCFLGKEPSSHLRCHFFQLAFLKKADLMEVLNWVTLSNGGQCENTSLTRFKIWAKHNSW